MNEPGFRGDQAGPGELARLAAIARHLLHARNRLAFALIVASIVIGSAILISAHAGPHWEELPLLGIAWAVLALKSGKL
jgi:hypothetical protein